ncbi:hypothetical protein SAMN04489735_1007122 [Aneurinibacillus thermoaerophilus]|nr:hypothetical protein ACH33_13400 [Aneurinibacillus sp. XH2]SDG98946.1 hypothetical protein SAMN04489735_1007122 [Aneurinibacillus thermoaerophilus]
MEAIEELDGLHRRFERLRLVVESKRMQVKWIEEEVRLCFQESDMQGIAELARERERLLKWIEMMEKFIIKWERYWHVYESASGWLSPGLHAQE